MHRLIPELIQQKFASDETSGSFAAVALFVDISGSTAITEALMGHGQHGAEVLANIIRDVFDPLIVSIFEQGGYVTNLAGDAFTAVFAVNGDPHDAFERALAAAWQVQRAMADSPSHQTPYGRFAVSMKVGMAAGNVSWGIIKSVDGRRATYYFRGAAIEGCTRAEKLAEPGEVIVDAAAFAFLQSRLTAEPTDDHFRISAITGDLPASAPFDLSRSSQRF